MLSGSGREGGRKGGREGGAEVRYQQIESGASCDERRGAVTEFIRLINFNQSRTRRPWRKVYNLKRNLSVSIRLMSTVNYRDG